MKESLGISSPFWKSEQGSEIVVDNFVITILIFSDFSNASQLSDFFFLNKTGAVSDYHLSFSVSDSEDTLFVFSDDLNNEILIFGVNTSWDGEEDRVLLKESSGKLSEIPDTFFHGRVFLVIQIKVSPGELIFSKIFVVKITMKKSP